jgi:23S rRNA (guanosine2251-2'-O)-methyltransferase
MISNKTTIFGLRPVIEAMQHGKEIDKVLIQFDLQGAMAGELRRLVKEHNVPCQFVPLEKLNRITMKNHQGVIAEISPITYYKIENLLPTLFESRQIPLLVMLDGITDVRNMGAIVRTAECAGAHAVIIPQSGTASLNADSMKTSAGALNIIPVCREVNLSEALNYIRNSGVQAIACSEKANDNYTDADLTLPILLIIGSEGSGISPELLRNCDKHVKIPLFGKIVSLNVSVSAGIILFEAMRQRSMNNEK